MPPSDSGIPFLQALPHSEGQYEEYIARVHESFRPYQERTIAKWNSKTRLSSGKVTSKAFVQVDHSVLGQIQHVSSVSTVTRCRDTLN